MAKKINLPERGKAKTSNPIAHVVYQAVDLAGIEAGGGGTKELVPVTPELRRKLQAGVRQAAKAIALEAAAYPDIPSVLVMHLRETAIAKSHRPENLAYAAGMPTAGHGPLDEMLVTANAASLTQLNQVIAQRDTKKIRANLSAIDGFEAWGVQRRLSKSLRGLPLPEVYENLRAPGRRLMVRLFSHSSTATTQLVQERMVALIAALGINSTTLSQRVGPPLFLLDFDPALTLQSFLQILQYQGVRHVLSEPHVIPTATVAAAPAPVAGAAAVVPQFTARGPTADMPIVGVFDTGVDPRSAPLAPWVVSRDPYVLPPETDYVHGTSVSSLIVDGPGLNAYHPQFPVTPCKIHDVCALETQGSRIGDLILRLREAIGKRPDIKVWNLSIGGGEIAEDEFSEFGRELDALSDAHGVLFVVAAGNYGDLPRRAWPVDGTVLADKICSPSDSVRAITVGAVSHRESAISFVRLGEPAPYSRRGPGPVFTPKPDIVHLGGSVDTNMDVADLGVHVLTPAGFGVMCGTSFASPIAASMAAHTWQGLLLPGRVHPLSVSAMMIKALMIHSAQLNSPDRTPLERRYYGAGLPGDIISLLYDSDSSFTVLFELDIADATKWRKAPFPIPQSLLHDGKLRCEVVMTAAYAPPLNSAAGSEYVRVNVDVGFGTLTPDDDGVLQFHGQVPADGEPGTNGFEEAQVAHGGKWSPVKTYRKQFKNGRAGNIWAVQASIVRRAYEPKLVQPLRVIILVTLRALDGNSQVYEDGQRALAASNWLSQNLATRVQLPV